MISVNRETIVSIVRWFLESETLRASLRGTLFDLHDELMRDFRVAFEELALEPGEADVLSAAVMAMLDGNLLLSLLDPDPAKHGRRRAGLRRVAERMLGHAR